MRPPQQPEIRRSERSAAVEDQAKIRRGSCPAGHVAEDPPHAVPEDNQPGHHPEPE
jgi:hypothetical protein